MFILGDGDEEAPIPWKSIICPNRKVPLRFCGTSAQITSFSRPSLRKHVFSDSTAVYDVNAAGTRVRRSFQVWTFLRPRAADGRCTCMCSTNKFASSAFRGSAALPMSSFAQFLTHLHNLRAPRIVSGITCATKWLDVTRVRKYYSCPVFSLRSLQITQPHKFVHKFLSFCPSFIFHWLQGKKRAGSSSAFRRSLF